MSCRDDLVNCRAKLATRTAERDDWMQRALDAETRYDAVVLDNTALRDALAACEGTDPPPPPSSSTWNGFTGQNQPPATWRPGSANSPFNQRVDHTKVHPRSQAKIDWLISFDDNDTPRGLSNVVIWDRQASGKSAAHAICWASDTDPLYTVKQGRTWNRWISVPQVRIPPQAEAGLDGYDYQLSVVQPGDGTTWDFWQFERPKDDDGNVLMGGYVPRPKTGGDVWCSTVSRGKIDGSLVAAQGGATQASFDLAAGQIRGEEMVAGKIDHALFLVVPGAARSGYCVAPVKPSSTLPLTPGTDKIEVGQRFFLDYTAAQIDAMPIKAFEKVIYKALAEYGGYVGDGGGSDKVLLSVEPLSGSTYVPFGAPDPWVNYAKQFAAIYNGGYPLWWTQNVVDWRNRLKVAA